MQYKSNTITTSLLLIGLLSMSNAVFAMDLAMDRLINVQDTQNNSFADYDVANTGVYFALGVGSGTLKTKTTQLTYQDGTVWRFDGTANKTSAMNVELGYQISSIDNLLLRMLQVKRLSYGLELSSVTSKFSGQDNDPDYSTMVPTIAMRNKSLNVMFNVKANVFKVWRFSPYLLGGVGLSKSTLNYNITTQPNSSRYDMDAVKKQSFAYQFGAGVDFFVTNHFNLSAGYRFFNAGNLVGATTGNISTIQASPVFATKQAQWVASIQYNF